MFNKKRIFTTVAALGVIALGLAACGSNSKSSSSNSSSSQAKITAVGSTALQPLVEKAASNYQSKNSSANISVQGGGSGTGLSQVQEGSVQIGNSDIFAQQQKGIDSKKLVDHQVAVVGIAPVVNKDVGVKNVSMDQLRQIFTGKITNWKQVGGKNEKITIVNRVKGSGTRATFEAAVMNGQSAIKSQEQDSNGTVQKIVSSTPGAISYLSFSYINSSLQELSIDNVTPTSANVETNKWKIWSYEHMYTKGQPNKTTKAFLKYIDSTEQQKNLVKKMGYISIHDMKVSKNANNQVMEEH
ncbi:phosphate ABC transporter substrate-binding protein PstS family protein [Paucilactobacillus suebicus]|uniref:Phosphate-binding protein n=1 Tax=Paucilactobacillus suebicus DSM 5007 = KCTC 3549 TaxID=1423807 RepID=A0A0R1W5Y1_9LACO|nr:phosphate ABC transporter substrate-binding protein PstS family protein [Paucilactobacillus suebicus]KRM10742.1 phosphate binding protein [Paucilactobacillus suebicus DSM 5007 = KCTC 3549]